MATLTLTQVWINRLDTGEGFAANSKPGRVRTHAVSGDVRSYAGGRQRAVATTGESSVYEVELELLTLSNVELLRSWVTVPVQIRDHRGQRFYAVFFTVPVTEHKAPYYSVHLTCKFITVTED